MSSFNDEFVKKGCRVETKNYNLATALRFLGIHYSREFEYSDDYKKNIYFYVFEDSPKLRKVIEELFRIQSTI